MAMIHPYTASCTYTYDMDTNLIEYIYIYIFIGSRHVSCKNFWFQVSWVYGTYPTLHISQQQTTRTWKQTSQEAETIRPSLDEILPNVREKRNWIWARILVWILFFSMGTFPCNLLHFRAETSTLLNFGAKLTICIVHRFFHSFHWVFCGFNGFFHDSMVSMHFSMVSKIFSMYILHLVNM